LHIQQILVTLLFGISLPRSFPSYKGERQEKDEAAKYIALFDITLFQFADSPVLSIWIIFETTDRWRAADTIFQMFKPLS